MNPFKPKLSTKNKLLNRFNVSINTKHEQSFTQRVHSAANEQDQNILRYRNHISFLQCRVDQQQATIEKLNCEIQTNFSNQSKLNAQILRLQRDNKKMLDNLYEAENRIRQLQQEYNNKMLHCSIQRIERQLNISKIRKRNKTLEDLENPEKGRKPIKSMRLSIMQNTGKHEIPFKTRPVKSSLRISPQIYTFQINNSLEKKDISFSQNKGIEVQQQIKIALQKQKNKISKLQQAVYYLKKQLRDQQKAFKEQIRIAQQKINEQKETEQCKILKNEFGWQILQLQAKVSEQAGQVEKKRQYIIQIQSKYGEELGKMQEMMNQMDKVYKELIEKKDKQNQGLWVQIEKLKQSMHENNRSEHSRQLSQSTSPRLFYSSSKEFGIIEQTKLELKCIELQQINDEIKQQSERLKKQLQEKQGKLNEVLLLMKERQKQMAILQKQLECKYKNLGETQDNLERAEIKEQISQVIIEDEKMQSTNNADIILAQKLKKQNVELSLKLKQLETKTKDQQNQQQKVLKLRVFDLQSQLNAGKQLIERFKNIQANLIEGKRKAQQQKSKSQREFMKRVLMLEEQITQRNQQIEKVLVLNRRFQGEVAEKQYFINMMTQQMIAIKNKLQVQKQESSSQTEGDNQEGRILHTEQTVETQQEDIEQLKYYYRLSIKEKDQEIDRWKLQYQGNEKEIQKLVIEIQQCQDKIRDFKQLLEDVNQKLSIQDQEIYQKNKQIENLRKDNHNLEQKVAFLNQYFSQPTNAEA